MVAHTGRGGSRRIGCPAGAGGWFSTGGGSGTGTGFGSGEDIDLDELLGGLFSGRGRRGWGPVPGADQEAELVLTMEEAYWGGWRSITLSGPGGHRLHVQPEEAVVSQPTIPAPAAVRAYPLVRAQRHTGGGGR